MTTKETLVRLVDELPKSQFVAARRYLEYFRDTSDPVLRKLLNAPLDDEELTQDDKAALRDARQDLKRGTLASLDDVRAELDV